MRKTLIIVTTAALALPVTIATTATAGAIQQTTAVTAAIGDPVIAAAGDIACAPPATRRASSCHQDATADLVANGGYDAVLTVGDNQYNCGQLSAYQQVYDRSWGRVKGITKPIPGEDDYAGGGCSTPGASGYFTYFGAAATPRQPTCTQACAGYYSYDIGAWHVVALNTACSEPGVGGCGATSPQVKWLQSDLAANRTACTLAVMHRPYWANGNVVRKYRAIVKTLYAAGVDVLLTGNSHLYARYAPQDPDSRATAAGIREFIVGTGGKSHSTLQTALPNREAANDRTFGVLRLTLHPTSYDWKFVPEAGSTYTDQGSTACR